MSDQNTKSAYKPNPALVFPASAPRILVAMYGAICDCELSLDPDSLVKFLEIFDPRDAANVIVSLATDTTSMPRVWSQLTSVTIESPFSIDDRTAKLLDLLEGDHFHRSTFSNSDLLLCSLVGKCAEITSQLRSPDFFPSPRVWKRLSKAAREIAQLTRNHEAIRTATGVMTGSSDKRTGEEMATPYLRIAQLADIMVRSKASRISRAKRGFIDLVLPLSDFFRAHIGRPLDREVADIVSVISGEVIDTDRVKMRRTRRDQRKSTAA